VFDLRVVKVVFSCPVCDSVVMCGWQEVSTVGEYSGSIVEYEHSMNSVVHGIVY
jgi:hypothetical protein